MANDAASLWDDEDGNPDNNGADTGSGNGEGANGGDNTGTLDPDNNSGEGNNNNNDNNSGEGEGTSNGAENAEAAPGIEQFLSQYGITGGLISFESEEANGEPVLKHYNDLSSEEQFNVLSSLAAKGSPDIAAKYDLDPNEIGLLNYVRTYAKENTGATANDAIESLAQQRVQQLLAIQESSNVDYSKMSDDAVMMKWLTENSTLSEADRADELTRMKESRLYESQVKSARAGFINEQVASASAENEAYNLELEAEREEDRKVIAAAVAGTNEVVGFPVDNAVKNEVLGKLLEVNQHGDSVFMGEVFSNPSALFKAAWLYYNAESVIGEMVKNHKRDLANEFHRGKTFATTGFPTSPQSGTGNPPPVNNGGGNSGGTPAKTNTAENLWENED